MDKLLLAAIAALTVAFLGVIAAVTRTGGTEYVTTLQGGDRLEVVCEGKRLRIEENIGKPITARILWCEPLPATPTPTPAASTNTPNPFTSTATPATPTATLTATPTTAPTSVPPAPTNTPSSGAGCVENCGTPRFFCDTGNWAFCDDYRDLYCPVPAPWDQTDPRCTFPDKSRETVLTADSFSSSDPNYEPHVDQVAQTHGWFFNQQEHFHSNIEDGNFGMAVTRHHQPVDLTSERHLHFEVDFDTSSRRYVRFMLSPDLTKAIVDDRNGVLRPPNALDVWVRDGVLSVNLYKGGQLIGTSGENASRIRDANNVRSVVDVYVSRTSFRLVINGQTHTNMALPDIGFNMAYLYLSQVSYNPCKDWQCSNAEQIKHWDNVAWDGPVIPRNALTPNGMQDVMFNAFRATSCSVRGVPATAVGGATTGPVWVTWVARMPVQAVGVGDVSCNYAFFNNTDKMSFEIVRQ